MAEKLYGWAPYAYCYDNPIKHVDKDDGKIGETVWDVFSLIMGVESFTENVSRGNIGAAILDGVGIIADAAAVALPLVPGGAGAAIKGIRAVDKAADAVSSANKVDKAIDVSKTSRAARREVMREQGIPTSQQPKSQSKNASGREYRYDVPKEGGGTKEKSVQQQTLDRSHAEQPHWEAGDIRKDKQGNNKYNRYGWPRLDDRKSKEYYEKRRNL